MLAISLPAIAQEQKEFRINKNLTIYNDVMRQLDLNYVDTLNYDQLVKMSIDAMLSKLDPYTVYLPEDKTEDLQFMTTGAYGGIGAVISQRNGKSYITDPYEVCRHNVTMYVQETLSWRLTARRPKAER